ncbi:MAG: hypothetical protein AAB605_02400 [Patescibacteria group bacterium]
MRSAGIVLVAILMMPPFAYAKGEDAASQVLGGVQEAGHTAVQSIESLRLMVFEGSTAKIEALKEARAREEERLRAEVKDDVNVDALITAQARPHVDNVEDSSGIVEGLMMQALQVVTFIFGQMFVFYPLLIIVLLWFVRFVWRKVAAR